MKNYNILCLLVAGRGFVRSGNRDGIAKQGGASHGQCPLAARKTKAMVKTMALSPAKGRGFVRSGNRDGIAKQGGASHGQCPLAARKTKAMVKTMALSLVAGRGFEPPDLWVMSPTSYRTAPPRDQAPLKVLDYHNIFCAVCQVNFQNFCKFQRKLAFCWGSVLQYAHESV